VARSPSRDPDPSAAGDDDRGPEESAERVLVVFTVGETVLAVAAALVDTVVGAEAPTPVPGAPPHVLGLMPAGERVLPLIDLATLLGLERERDVDADPLFRRILLVRAGAFEAGLVCHRTRGLFAVRAEEMTEPNVLQGPRLQPFLAAELDLGDTVVGVLDLHALLEAAAVP
jgi:chemotaxis signal transduction protein